MADTKISSLTSLVAADGADVLPIVDVAPTATTKKISVTALLGGGAGFVDLTDAATIISDNALQSRSRFKVVLGGNRTLAGPSNPIDGATATFRLKQDATGGRTITLASADWITPSDITVTLSTAGNTTDFLTGIYCSSGNKWVVVALTKGATGI